MTPNTSFADLQANISQRIESLHEANKAMFFSCLTPETVEKLEPEYA